MFGLLFMVAVLGGGSSLCRAMGGDGASLAAALTYSNVVFAGAVLLWIFNSLANVIRGTGNMTVPALVTCVGVVVLLPLSPCLILGWGPFPRLGVAGGGVAVVITVQTNLIIVIATALVGRFGPAAMAGYGVGSRLEYLLVPIVFGLGGPLVAMVGTNISAGRRRRALRIAWIGAAAAAAVTEAIGLAAAAFPRLWISLFDTDPAMLEAGARYLRVVGPFYGMFGLGMALYFASQGAGRLLWPLIANVTRLIIAAIGGWLALRVS